MKAIDFAKAAGIAAAVLVIDVLIAIGVVFVWAAFFEPAHSKTLTFYATAGVPIARWSTRIAGTALIFGAGWLYARRRPERNAILFAVTLVAFYAVFDGASVAFEGFFTRGIAITMLLKLAGGVTGAFAGVRAKASAREDRSLA